MDGYAPVAQLDRAFACGARGRTFESYRVYHEIAIRTLTRQRCHVGALVGCRGAPTRKGGRALMSGQSCGVDEAWVAGEDYGKYSTICLIACS